MIRNRKKWHNKVVSIMLAMLMVVSVVVQYPLNSIAENVQTGSEEYLGVQTEAKVYDDFENDIWLQYQQKEMQVGDTTNLRPWRVEQIISNAVANDVQRPVFHFEIIKGDSISLDTESSTEKAVVTAKKAGTSVVKVTYDAVEYGGKTWGAISPVNTAYAVFTVGETGTATINCSEKLQNWRHYDTIYYNEGDTVPFTFEASADGAESLKVTLNGLEIQGDGNTYTANLENRSNIIGIEATDADGNVKSLYRVVDARFIEINVENKTNPDAALEPGDTANISFRGVTMPVYKLATIYNPVWTSNSAWGKSDATYLSYSNETLGEFKGQCQQWDLATNNDFDVTFKEAGGYTFTSQNGIFSEWWGSPLGADITANGSGEPNLNAPVLKDWFSTLPSFTVSVTKDIPVENITLDQEALELQVGDVSSLQATVTPADATNQTVEWNSDHTDVVTVDQDGVLNAVSAGKAVITAKAGEKTATCEVTVKEKSEQPEKTPVGTVTVSIQDMIPTPDGEDWPEAKGVILKNTNVSIYEEDSMMDAIVRACEENGIKISLNASKTYITAVDGLEQFDRGAASGWMGTLNGWFTDKGFASFTVAGGTFADGDVITLEYTTNYGSDLTDTTDVTGELKSPGNNAGDLLPEYKRDVYKYTLTVPKDTTEVSFRPESFNRYNNAAIRVGDKSYRYGDAIPVSEGTQIKITSTPTSFMSLLGLKDGVTYTITVKSLEEPEKTPVGTVTVSVQDMIPTPEGKDWPEAKGVILDNVKVSIYEDDTMIDAIERACVENNLEIVFDSKKSYITEIDGLGEMDRGEKSGWFGTLNGWLPDKAMSDFSVANGNLADGDLIAMEYSTDWGNDLTDTTDVTGELKSLGNNTGELAPQYSRDVYEYTLTIPKDTTEVSFRPESFNRNNKVTIQSNENTYRPGAMIPVEEGTIVNITSVPVSYTTLVEPDAKVTYQVTVKYEDDSQNPDPENPDPEKPDPQEPEKEEITLTDTQYGVSLTGKELTKEMQLIVSKLTKDDAAVDEIRKAIPSSKGVFALYHVELRQDGKEVALSDTAKLNLPVGKKYNGNTMDVLLYIGGEVKKLSGTVTDGYITVKVTQLGDFGVVTDMAGDGASTTDKLSSADGSGNSQTGTVKTGDSVKIEYLVYLIVACAVVITAVVVVKKKRQGK